MNIDLESRMLQAATENEYLPVFRGEPMDVEASMPEVSLKNLRKLLAAGLKVTSMMVVENGHVLIVFQTGETYLATGFAVASVEDNHVGDPTRMFAQFASEAHTSGTQREWENQLAWFYPKTFRGIINPSRTPVAGKPRVFKPE